MTVSTQRPSVTLPRPTVHYAPTALQMAPAHYAPQYAPMQHQPYAPQQLIVQKGRATSRIADVLLALLVIVIVAVAAIAGYALSRQAAPTPQEMTAYQNIAEYQGFQDGRVEGMAAGRDFSIAVNRRIAYYKAQIARQRQFNKGYAAGRKAANARPARRSYSGYRSSGYRAYRPSSNQYAVSGALGAAQQYANATNSAVDVEIYND